MASLEAVTRALHLLDSAGLVRQGQLLTREQAELRVVVFVDALSDISDEALLGAARQWVRKSKFWPTPADIRDVVRPRAVVAAERSAQAERCYERILMAYEDGRELGFRDIREKRGYAAAVAFAAAGGNGAFSWCEPGRDQEFRHKRFVEEFVEQDEGIEAGDMAAEAEQYRIPQAEAEALLYGRKIVKEIK